MDNAMVGNFIADIMRTGFILGGAFAIVGFLVGQCMSLFDNYRKG